MRSGYKYRGVVLTDKYRLSLPVDSLNSINLLHSADSLHEQRNSGGNQLTMFIRKNEDPVEMS